MAQLGETFNPNEVEPRSPIDPVQPGDYVMQIVESDVQATKSGSGWMLILEWEIVEGEYEKRKVWQRINYRNSSQQAQTIGQRQLAEICAAIGVSGNIDDSSVLHFQPVRVRLAIEQDKSGNYDPQNAVKRVKPLNTDPPGGKPAPQPATRPRQAAGAQPAADQSMNTAQAQAANAATPAPRSNSGTRPWGNRAAGAR